jgi:hypothetical protein
MAQNVVQLPAEFRGNQALEKAWSFHRDKVQQIEDRFRPHFENADMQMLEAQRNWNTINGQVNRLPSYARIWYLPFLFVLAVTEIPVNRLSFELFFGESPLLSLIVAFLVGMIFMVLAHFTGIGFRRLGYNVSYIINQNPGASPVLAALPSLTWIGFCLSLILAICYGVGVLRQGYLAFATQADPSFSQMIDSQQYIEAAARLALAVTLGIEGWIFFSINLAIVTVGILAAFFCHDPHPEYEKVDLERKAATKTLGRIRVQHGRAIANEEGRFANEKRQMTGN